VLGKAAACGFGGVLGGAQGSKGGGFGGAKRRVNAACGVARVAEGKPSGKRGGFGGFGTVNGAVQFGVGRAARGFQRFQAGGAGGGVLSGGGFHVGKRAFGGTLKSGGEISG